VGATGEEGVVSRGRLIAGIVVLVVIAAIVGGVFYSSAASAPSVTTATATAQTLSVTVTASGKIEPASRADVFAPTAGTLDSVSVSDGATVTAGQTLAVMDTQPLEVQLLQAKAGLSGAKAQLAAINMGVPSAIDKAAAQAGVNAAQAAYDGASGAYAAVFSLHGADPSWEATLAQMALAEKQAYAALESAKSGSNKLSLAAKVSAAKASANAAVDSANAAVRYAQDNLDNATLVAPIDGIVIFNPTGAPGTDGMIPKAAAGTAVAPGTAVFTVIDYSKLYFDAQVDEADISKVATGMKANVTLDAFANATFTGTVSSIRRTAIQTTTGGIAFPVLLSVSEAGNNLLVGMSGSADIEVNSVTGALTVPIEAVLSSNGKSYVFVVKNNKVTQVAVTTGVLTDTSAQVLTGLAQGDVVATSQLTSLTDGMTVRVQ
jgi:RND family efflux transporter MFP subunit